MDVVPFTKGDTDWLQVSVNRRPRGTELWFRSCPEVEDFISTNSGQVMNTLSEFALEGIKTYPDEEIHVYALNKNLNGSGYTLATVGFSYDGEGKVPLGFLRFKGIGSKGVRVLLTIPYNQDELKKFCKLVVKEAYNFIGDYIAPVAINLRISSTEV